MNNVEKSIKFCVLFGVLVFVIITVVMLYFCKKAEYNNMKKMEEEYTYIGNNVIYGNKYDYKSKVSYSIAGSEIIMYNYTGDIDDTNRFVFELARCFDDSTYKCCDYTYNGEIIIRYSCVEYIIEYTHNTIPNIIKLYNLKCDEIIESIKNIEQKSSRWSD